MKGKIFREKNGSEVRIVDDIKNGKIYYTFVDAVTNCVGEDEAEEDLFLNEINKYFEEIK